MIGATFRTETTAPLPTPRGECSAMLLKILTRGAPTAHPGAEAALDGWRATVRATVAGLGAAGSAGATGAAGTAGTAGAVGAADAVDVAAAALSSHDDLQLTLYLLYALHLHGLAGVSDAWEWEPALLGGTRVIETAFEAELRRRTADLCRRLELTEHTELRAALVAVTEADVGPPTSTYLRDQATLAQAREFLVVKSIYQLKEADPHTFALPRVSGRPKNAAVEIQSDEYGNGSLRAMHSELFRTSLRCAGLDTRNGAYVDAVPAVVLANDNAAVMFGLHRRLRGATLGHLAALEMTSSAPMRKYARGLRRVGLPEEAVEYFLEHVGVDAVHEQLAIHEMVLPLVAQTPTLRPDVLLGGATATLLDGDVARHLVGAWASGASALREPLP